MEYIKNLKPPKKSAAVPINLTPPPLIKARKKSEDMEIVRSDFLKWCGDDELVRPYERWGFAGPRCLVRVYKYIPEDVPVAAKRLIDVDGSSLNKRVGSRVLPFVKVLVAGDTSSHAVGDVMAIDQKLAREVMSPLWIEWMKGKKKRPIPETSLTHEPEKYLEGIYAWIDFMFIADPFNAIVTEKDKYTFLIPDALMNARYDYKK